MDWADLFAGLAFWLIFEGLFPFASPQQWRRSLTALASISDGRLRAFGAVAVIAGLVLLSSVRG